MRKIFLLLSSFLISSVCLAQFTMLRQNTASTTDSTTEIYVTLSPLSTYGHSYVAAKFKDSTKIIFYKNRIIMENLGITNASSSNALYVATITDSGTLHNTLASALLFAQSQITGLPDSILSRMKKSQVDSAINSRGFLTTETDPVWTAASGNYFTKTASDARYLQSESDPFWHTDSSGYYKKADITALFTNYYNKSASDSRYLQSFTEVDPIWTAASSNYYTKTLSDARYLQSFTELDPVYTTSAASGITSTNISNWNTAFGWGNHATAGYATATNTMTFSNKTWNGVTIADAYISSASTWNAKQSAITTGSTAQYLRGDLSLATFPTIPAAQVQSDYTAASGVSQILNKPSLGTAAATNITDYATSAQGALASSALQPSGNGSTLTGLTSTQVGLANVNNTSDATKNSATATITNKDLTSGTNIFPTLNQNTTGNSGSATKLQTARTINGVPFDGTTNVTIPNAITPTYNYSVTRPINSTSFTPSTTQPYRVYYNIEVSCTATIGSSSNGYVVLQYFNGTTWVNTPGVVKNSNTVTLAIALNSVTIAGGTISGEFPANTQIRLVSVSAGTTTITYNSGEEVLY